MKRKKPIGRPKTTKFNIPLRFKRLYFKYRSGKIPTKVELAKQAGVSYNTMKKYVRILQVIDDEFYTPYSNVEEEFRKYVDYFSDKIIYCPCDSDKSNIVVWLKKNTKAFVINTSDDFHNHKDLFEQCDIILTNGPFSIFTEMFKYFYSFGKELFIVAPFFGLKDKLYNEMFIRGELHIDKSCIVFERPDGSKKEILATWITTVDPALYSKQKH